MAAMRSERRIAMASIIAYKSIRVAHTDPLRTRQKSGWRHVALRKTGVAQPACRIERKRRLAAPQKRRPPVGGRSLGRKRPRRACTANTVRGIFWRQIRQMQDLNTDFAVLVPC